MIDSNLILSFERFIQFKTYSISQSLHLFLIVKHISITFIKLFYQIRFQIHFETNSINSFDNIRKHPDFLNNHILLIFISLLRKATNIVHSYCLNLLSIWMSLCIFPEFSHHKLISILFLRRHSHQNWFTSFRVCWGA